MDVRKDYFIFELLAPTQNAQGLWQRWLFSGENGMFMTIALATRGADKDPWD